MWMFMIIINDDHYSFTNFFLDDLITENAKCFLKNHEISIQFWLLNWKCFFLSFCCCCCFGEFTLFFLLKGNRVSIEKRKKTFLTGNRQYHIIIRILLPVKWNEWKGFFSVHYSVFLLWKNFKLFVVVEFKSRPW